MNQQDTTEKWRTAEQLYQAIGDSPLDLNTEWWLSNALENGLSAAELILACDGFFHRGYGRDILFPEWKEDASGRPYIQLVLSRSSICDQLPEGALYPNAGSDAACRRAADMVADHTKNKKIGKHLRLFFQPLENHFIWQRVHLFREEEHLLAGHDPDVVGELLFSDPSTALSLPHSLRKSLTSLLPYAHRIAGEPELMAGCLENILQEKVRVEQRPSGKTGAGPGTIQGLGKQRLGIDMVSNGEFEEPCPKLEFIIGPLTNSSLSEYLAGGDRQTFLNIFYEFFAPVEVEVITTIDVEPGENKMAESVLGYAFI